MVEKLKERPTRDKNKTPKEKFVESLNNIMVEDFPKIEGMNPTQKKKFFEDKAKIIEKKVLENLPTKEEQICFFLKNNFEDRNIYLFSLWLSSPEKIDALLELNKEGKTKLSALSVMPRTVKKRTEGRGIGRSKQYKF